MWSAILFSVLIPQSFALPTYNQGVENVPLTQESWEQYRVDAWLSTFMQENNISPVNFLQKFPEAVHHLLDCSLDQPCTYADDGPLKDYTQVSLILVSLTHFNDLFRMISRLWSNDPFLDNPIAPGFPYRTVLIQQFDDIYSDFSIHDLSTAVAPEIIRVFFNSIWYIPGAIPNQALVTTIDNAIAALHKPDWAWKDYAISGALGVSNIEQTVEDIFGAWRQQYNEVVANSSGVSVLDFIKGGQMLNVKYAKELTSVGWHKQAYHMYTRQILSLVLEANGIIIHRGNYDNLEPNDATMGLDFSFDDPSSHETYSPVHFGVDNDGNITRQYSPSNPNRTFNHVRVSERVVYGQSWQCFESTNSNKFTSDFVRAWDQPAYLKSLFIPDWDGTSDGFDANNPLCTFNLAINNQPSDLKTSWFIEEMNDACPNIVGSKFKTHITTDYELYHAVMLAADAWVYTAVYNRSSNASETLAAACQAASKTSTNSTTQVGGDRVSNMEFNLIAETVAHVSEILLKVASGLNPLGSSLKGGWSAAAFEEKPPLIKDRPTPPPSISHSEDVSDPKGGRFSGGDDKSDGEDPPNPAGTGENPGKDSGSKGDGNKGGAGDKGDEKTSA